MTPQEYNKLREQEIIGQEMADEKLQVYSIKKRHNEVSIS